MVLGEVGIGADEMAQSVLGEMSGEMDCAIAVYKGAPKKFFQRIAEQLDIATTVAKFNAKGEEVGEKDLSADELKEQIALNISDEKLLIFPEAKRLTTGIRYWLEDLMDAGARLVCFAVVNPGRDIFLEMLEVELELPSDAHIREVMESEAKERGLSLSQSRLSQLQPLAGRNPMLAKKVIRAEALGLNKHKGEHSQYLDITPLIMAVVALVGVLKFVGLGTGDRALYIVGGIAIMVGLSLRYIGQLGSKSRKRFGQ